MNEPSDTSDTPARPQDYAGLRAELAELTNDFVPVINELWPRLEDHKYRWELHSYGLPEGHDREVVADVIALLIEALKGIGIADSKLLQAHTKADCHNPAARIPPDQACPLANGHDFGSTVSATREKSVSNPSVEKGVKFRPPPLTNKSTHA
jgi:hypothetical protein